MKQRKSVENRPPEVLILLALLILGACGNSEPPAPEATLGLTVEHIGEALKITRKDAFPWHEVTFTINRRYSCQVDLVEDKEILLPYTRFVDENGKFYEYDPHYIRLRIDATEGYWQSGSAMSR
jgi:hypothetical protein